MFKRSTGRTQKSPRGEQPPESPKTKASSGARESPASPTSVARRHDLPPRQQQQQQGKSPLDSADKPWAEITKGVDPVLLMAIQQNLAEDTSDYACFSGTMIDKMIYLEHIEKFGGKKVSLVPAKEAMEELGMEFKVNLNPLFGPLIHFDVNTCGGCYSFRMQIASTDIFMMVNIGANLGPLSSIPNRKGVVEFINKVNTGILAGGFEVDPKYGEFRYKFTTVLAEDGVLTKCMVKTQFELSVAIMDKYLPGVIRVAKHGMDPYEAWRACETGQAALSLTQAIPAMLEKVGRGPASLATRVSVTPRPPVKSPPNQPTKAATVTTAKTAPAKTSIEIKVKEKAAPKKSVSPVRKHPNNAPRDPPASADEFEC